MINKIEQLKKQWNTWDKSWNSVEQYNGFIEKYPVNLLEKLTLEEYTNIKINDNDEYLLIG